MHNATKYGVLLVVLALFSVPSEGFGQATGKLSLDARVGVVLPAGTLADITDLGGTAGGSLTWHFHPNWALRGDFDYMKLDDGSDDFGVTLSPPMDLMFFGGAIELNFSKPRMQEVPFTFNVSVGAGATNMKVDDTFDAGHPANGFDNTYLTFQGGANIGYQLKDWINIFVNGKAYLILIESGDTLVFPISDSFDHAWVFPLTAGVRLTFLR